ncbi:hypothetical protein ScPMuIL_013989 [Solemya velum]
MDASGDKRVAVRLVLNLKGGEQREIVKRLPNSNQTEKVDVKLCALHRTLLDVQTETNAILSDLVEEEKSRPNSGGQKMKGDHNDQDDGDDDEEPDNEPAEKKPKR